MLDTLKSLALKYTSPSGNLSLWLLPFTSMRANMLYETFTELVPRSEWTNVELTLVNFDVYVLNVEVGKNPSPIEMIFHLMWQQRNEDLKTRYETFKQFYNDGFYTAFDLAFEATRDRTFDAPTELRKPSESASPEQSPATSLPVAS